jgi:hypothetical protein
MLDLEECAHGLQIAATVELTRPAESIERSSRDYIGTIEYSASAEAALEAYCRGSRVLKVGRDAD